MASVLTPTFWKKLGEAARLACGLPDYDNYLRHQREKHPGVTPMTRAAFIDDRQRARYRRGATRCC